MKQVLILGGHRPPGDMHLGAWATWSGTGAVSTALTQGSRIGITWLWITRDREGCPAAGLQLTRRSALPCHT